jgi:hypothetical protein
MIISDYMLHLARNKLAWPTMGTIPKTADQVLIQWNGLVKGKFRRRTILMGNPLLIKNH